MTPEQIATLAKRVHDVEGWNLGARSSRETRNTFWERVVGIVHWGHPVYNTTPDPRWHCKDPDGPGGRPQSDDVVVLMPSRQYWDCIPGAGADGYSFRATFDGLLPADQFVFVPSKPDGAGFPEPENPNKPPPHLCPPCPPCPPVPPKFDYPNEPGTVKAYQDRVKATYAEAGRRFPDPNDSDAFRWFTRYGYDCRSLPEPEAASKHIAALRRELGLSR